MASKPPTGKTGKRGVWVSEKCWLPPLSLHFAASITMNIPSFGWSEPLRAPQAPLWPAQTHANVATASMAWPVPKILAMDHQSKPGFHMGPVFRIPMYSPNCGTILVGKLGKGYQIQYTLAFPRKFFPCISHIAEPSGFGGTFQTNLHQERCYSWIFILQNRYWRFSSPIPHKEL